MAVLFAGHIVPAGACFPCVLIAFGRSQAPEKRGKAVGGVPPALLCHDADIDSVCRAGGLAAVAGGNNMEMVAMQAQATEKEQFSEAALATATPAMQQY